MRSWYQKKRWWTFGLFALPFLVISVPYSTSGPAMSCWTMANEAKNDVAMYEFARANNYNLEKTVRYMENSGMRLRNISTENKADNWATFVFATDYQNNRCAILNMVSIDGSIALLDVSINGTGDVRVVER